MRGHPLVPVIRRYMIAAAIVLLCLIWPELALGIFPLLCMPPLFSTCTIYSDDYATDKTGTDYTVGSGSFSVSGGVLSTSSASALITANTASAGGANGVVASAAINCATTSDKGRLIILYVDSNNYSYAEIQPGATNGTLKLFTRSGGADTQQDTTKTITGYTSGSKTLTMCYADGELMAGAGDATATFAGTLTVASTKVGLGTGSGSSSVTFDNLLYQKHKVDDSTCPACGIGDGSCAFCDGFASPHFVQVVVTGVVNSGCSFCTLENQTRVLTNNGGCTYGALGANICSAGAGAGPFFQWLSGAAERDSFSLNYNLGGSATWKSGTVGGGNPYDCFGDTGISGAAPSSSSGAECDWSAAIATVTII